MDDIDEPSFTIGGLHADVSTLKEEVKCLDGKIDKMLTSKAFYFFMSLSFGGITVWLGILTKLIVKGG